MSSILETDIIQGDIRYRPESHEYIHIPTNRKLASVSEVVKTVHNKKSWDGVDQAIVENARIRGSDVDRLMTRYVRDQRLTLVNEMSDVVERVVIAHRLYEEQFHGLPAEAQVIVFSLVDGVAGTLDFRIDKRIIADLKSTYSVENDWVLQLGAYAKYGGPVDRLGIIHLSPKVYPKGGVWIEYDHEVCIMFWDMALNWWRESKTMGKRAKK